MKSRPFVFVSDYPDIYKWWLGWKWKNPLPPEYLPPTGIMIENNGKKICCCFIYRTDSIWCIINWFLLNPKTTKEDRKGCVDFLIEKATEKAKEMGFKIAQIMTNHKGINKRSDNLNWKKSEILTSSIKYLNG